MTPEAEHFTGTVAARTLAAPGGESTLAVYAVTFEAAAHTHWHTHPKGQGLFVADGVALVQTEGEPAVRLAAGESIWIEAGRRHWHGAGPDSPMTHVAYQQAADDLRTVEWHEPVAASAYETAIEETH